MIKIEGGATLLPFKKNTLINLQKMMRLISLFGIFLFTTAQFLTAQVPSNNKNVEMIEKLIFGKSDTHYLGKPKDIAVGPAGKIFVADEDRMEIMIFEENGNYKNSIGRRGRGPGEFLSLQEITINKADELLVTDRFGFRITKFDMKGNVIDTYIMSKKTQDVVFFKEINQLSNSNYLVLYKKFGGPYAEEEMFHIWDQEFNKRILDFGSFSSLGFENQYAKLTTQFGMGSIDLLKNGNLLFAPNVYTGSIYYYQNQDDSWSAGNKIKGYGIPYPSSKVYTDNTRRGKDITTIHGPNGETTGEIFALSAGIFTVKNDKIVHFTMFKNPEVKNAEWVMGVELFDSNFNYIGYYPLKSFKEIYSHVFPVVRTKDSNNNFYMISLERGMPIIQKFSLDIQEQ